MNKERLKDIVSGLEFDSSDGDLWIEQLRSLNTEHEITNEEYNYILNNIDEILGE